MSDCPDEFVELRSKIEKALATEAWFKIELRRHIARRYPDLLKRVIRGRKELSFEDLFKIVDLPTHGNCKNCGAKTNLAPSGRVRPFCSKSCSVAYVHRNATEEWKQKRLETRIVSCMEKTEELCENFVPRNDYGLARVWSSVSQQKFKSAYERYEKEQKAKGNWKGINPVALWKHLSFEAIANEFMQSMTGDVITKEIVESAKTGRLCDYCGNKFSITRYNVGFFCHNCFHEPSVCSFRKARGRANMRSSWALFCQKPGALQRRKEKTIQTCRSKYGVDYNTQNLEIRLRQSAGIRKAHATRGSEILNKMQSTCLLKYGAKNPQQCPSIRAKTVKSQYNTKTVKVGNRTFYLQGYEPQILKAFIESKGSRYVEQYIFCTGDAEILPIPYGKDKKFYPDFYSKKTDTYYEVKSMYTLLLGSSRNSFKTNVEKAKAAAKAGIKVRWLVSDSKGVYIDLPHGWWKWTAEEVQAYLT